MRKELEQQVKSTVSEYIDADDENIVEEIGIRQKAIEEGQISAGSPAEEAVFEGETMGALDDVRELGLNIVRRANKSLHDLFCGSDSGDAKQREELRSAFKLGPEEVGAVIGGLLISAFGIAPAIAPLVGVVLAKRLMPIIGDELCKTWGKHVVA